LRLQAFLASDGASPGMLAALRRADPAAPDFLALKVVLPLCREQASAQEISRWVAVAKAFALTGPRRHAEDQPLGAALAAAGYSELRLEQLLSAPADVRDALVWGMCRRLAAHRCAVNFIDLAALLVTRESARLLALNLRIAQAYLGATKS
jgi:hypothetical protein